MTKETASKKKAEASHERPVTEGEKPYIKPKKIGSEIDEIFATKKRKRPEKEKINNGQNLRKVSGTNSKSNERLKIIKGTKNKAASKEKVFSNTTSRLRKRTADGFAIYSEEELGIGKSEAGGTGLCPFDCDCCF